MVRLVAVVLVVVLLVAVVPGTIPGAEASPIDIIDPSKRASFAAALWAALRAAPASAWLATGGRAALSYGPWVGSAVLAAILLSWAYNKYRTDSTEGWVSYGNHKALSFESGAYYFRVVVEHPTICVNYSGTPAGVQYQLQVSSPPGASGLATRAGLGSFSGRVCTTPGYNGENRWNEWGLMHAQFLLWLVEVGSPVPGPTWPGTTTPLPATWPEAVQDPRWPTIREHVIERVIERIKTVAGDPPSTLSGLGGAGVTFDPPNIWEVTGGGTPIAQPTVGPYPIPGTMPIPTPQPIPGEEEGIVSYLYRVMAWVVSVIYLVGEWIAAQQAAVTGWLAETLSAQVKWLSDVLTQALVAVTTGINAKLEQIRVEIAGLAVKLEEVKAAILALPTVIGDAVGAAITEAVNTALVPQVSTVQQWRGIPALIQTKPPFSLLPPADLFPAIAPGACTLPTLGPIEIAPGGSVRIEWPAFVCTAAGWVRTFILALFWVSLGWIVIQKIWPQVQI